MKNRDSEKVNEWDLEFPRDNRFEDWPLDTKVSISPDLKKQIAGTLKSAPQIQTKDK